MRALDKIYETTVFSPRNTDPGGLYLLEKRETNEVNPTITCAFCWKNLLNHGTERRNPSGAQQSCWAEKTEMDVWHTEGGRSCKATQRNCPINRHGAFEGSGWRLALGWTGEIPQGQAKNNHQGKSNYLVIIAHMGLETFEFCPATWRYFSELPRIFSRNPRKVPP